MIPFRLTQNLSPKADQPKAIDALSKGVLSGKKYQVLLGVTGSGKTFTMANVIAKSGKPSLIMAPNKTLAAQLYSEFKVLFPENAVEYFVSYYDYYQPEAYLPTTDTYIQKDSSINDMIDKLRHAATVSVLSRRDVIVVASVSCIFGLGDPEEYLSMSLPVQTEMELERDTFLAELVSIHYERNDIDFHRGVFRVRGDRVEIYPAYEENIAIRIDFFGDYVESIAHIDPLKGNIIKSLTSVTIFPASHYVTNKEKLKRAIDSIQAELKERIDFFRDQKLLIEAQRIEERTNFDIEMMLEMGYCNGIENYSRHITGRAKGEPAPTLIDYFPDDFLICIDESHISIPQLHGMYKGDRSRKETLIKHGFRLPSALDNRPLKFEEFKSKNNQVIFVSATPSKYELSAAQGLVVEQVVRPTGLLDPEIEVRSAGNQVDDLYGEIMSRIDKKERVLVTTLTKRMAEDLTDYYSDLDVRVRYMHSDIKTLERMDIITDLRSGIFDVLIGINLLREGLDLPEVSLVAILDADKEGFLRSERSLIQTCGRASRNVHGKVIMYADVITKSMNMALSETSRRRKIQEAYNKKHGIIPASIKKDIKPAFASLYDDTISDSLVMEPAAMYETLKKKSPGSLESIIKNLKKEMQMAVKELAFEKAARIRDQIKELMEISLL